MLKIIHTSDWHLGQRFFGWDRIEEQRFALEQLAQLISREGADVLLVSGDVFDTVNPSAEAESLYYSFLARICRQNPSLQVIITAGNHDSPYRLKAAASLMEPLGISIVSTINKRDDRQPDYGNLIIPLYKDGEIVANCVAVPYLRRGDLPLKMEEGVATVTFFQEAFYQAYDQGLPVVVMGHLFASSSFPRSRENQEFPDIIGSAIEISLDAFPQEIGYVALGHIHRQQQLNPQGTIRYAGSLLPMSFTEKDYSHGVVRVILDSNGTFTTDFLPIEAPARLIQVKGDETLLRDCVEKANEGIPDFRAPFLSLILQENHPRPDLLSYLRNAVAGKYLRLTKIALEKRDQGIEDKSSIGNKPLRELRPLDVAKMIYAENYNENLPPELEDLFNQVVEDIL